MDIVPSDGQVITQSLALKPGTYVLPDGLTVNADHVTLDGNYTGWPWSGEGRRKTQRTAWGLDPQPAYS